MTNEEAKVWLSAWKTRCIAHELLAVVVGLFLSLVLLFLDWCCIYAVCALILSGCSSEFAGTVAWYAASGSLPLLFLGNAFVRQDDLMPRQSGGAEEAVADELVPDGDGSVPVTPVAPKTATTALKVVLDVLFFGPRIAAGTTQPAVGALRAFRLDTTACADVVAKLHSAPRRLSYEEVAAAVVGGDASRVLRQLRGLEGILFLESAPQGLALGAELREKMDLFLSRQPGRGKRRRALESRDA